jgi:tetratricopeptide (TPR) repeat protein
MRGMLRRGLFHTFAALALSACAGAGTGGSTTHTVTIEPASFLMEVGASSTFVLRRPERSTEELMEARGSTAGAERRQILRELVVAKLFEAESAEGRSARRIRNDAERFAENAVRGSRDSNLIAEMDFVKLWLSWRANAANAASRAERFTDRHTRAGELLMLAWMIRGEIAFAADRFDDAIAAFRFALGQLEHPLYTYALLRTAHAYERLGRSEDAAQALLEVEQLGCARGASPFRVRLAAAAASERRSGVQRDDDGVMRPASCESEEESGSDGQWRPAE